MSDAAADPSDGSASVWEDIVDIFHQPKAVFERRRDGRFGLALLILALTIAVLTVVLHNALAPILDAEASRAAAGMIEKNPQMTAEQIATAQGFMEKTAMFGAGIFVPIAVFISGLILWVVARVVGAKIAVSVAIMIATYSLYPMILQVFANAAQGLLLPADTIDSRYSVMLSPVRFVDPAASPFLLTVLGGLDVFAIWIVVLIGIGLYATGRISRERAAIGAAIMWVVGLVPGLISALTS